MFISVFKLLKIGIGPSSSHTMGPMIIARHFSEKVATYFTKNKNNIYSRIQCTLKGSLSFTGKGHYTDKAIVLGLNGYVAEDLITTNVSSLIKKIWHNKTITINSHTVEFYAENDIIFSKGAPLHQHPNGIILKLIDSNEQILLTETYFSVGGGFTATLAEMNQTNNNASANDETQNTCPYPFYNARSMLQMSTDSGLSIANMKHANELLYTSEDELNNGLDKIWRAMRDCTRKGLANEGILPGSLALKRRAKNIHEQLKENPQDANINDWLGAYAIAVNEENAAGHMVVTAPTNGAAGVIPAVIYYFVHHKNGTQQQIRQYLLTASAIGSIIKHLASISGAEVGCQGEVGSAAAMAAAGLCAIRGGSMEQVEHAAEIALEHHLGMTCDPVAGLVQIPCIERNAFGAIKAYAATSLALHGTGEHKITLDSCISAMKQTGLEMSDKYKETSLGGLAVSFIEC